MWSQGKSRIHKWLSGLAALAFILAASFLGGNQLLQMAPVLKAASHGENSGASDSEAPASEPKPLDAPVVKKADTMAEPAKQPDKKEKPWWKKSRRRAVSSEPPEPEPKPEPEKVEPPLAAETKPETGPKPPPGDSAEPPPAAPSRQDADADPSPAEKVDFPWDHIGTPFHRLFSWRSQPSNTVGGVNPAIPLAESTEQPMKGGSNVVPGKIQNP